MTEKPICGANKSDGTVCRAAQGWGTSHPGSGRCKFHGGSSPSGEKFAARAAVMAMASEADAEPSEVLLKAIRCDWGAVTYVQERLAEINGRMLEAQDNPEKIYAATQQMGMWQEMYGDWVDRAAKHAKMALDAGVQERQVRLAEMTGALFAEAIRGILQGLRLSPAQQAAAPELVRAQLLAIDAQLAS